MADGATEGARWSTAINDHNHGPLVTITALMMMVASFLFLSFRMTIRWPWSKLIGYDDVATIIGSIFATAQSIAVLLAVRYGLGQHRDDLNSEAFHRALRAIWASDIVSAFALTGSKLAVSLLILRLSTYKRHVVAAQTISALIVAWGIAACVLSGLELQLSKESGRRGWIVVGAYSVALEVALFVLPVFLVWNLNMRMSAKATVVVGFAFRIPASALALARVLAVVKMLSSEDTRHKSGIDFTWAYKTPTIYTTIEMHYSLMAATIPCMHLFLRQFSTGYLGTSNDQLHGTIMGSKGNESDSYVLSSIRSRHLRTSKSRSRSTQRQDSESGAVLRALYQVTPAVTTISAGHHGRAESFGSDGSEKIMVRQTVDVRWQDSEPPDRTIPL